jgi:4-hydroxybenzoate polyprenyltransferase
MKKSMLEYLKLMRPFSGTLTSLMAVMGALAEKQFDIITLFLLFLLGFFSHAYGFVLNDIVDYKIDKYSKEIKNRPLITGTISIKQAWIFTILSLIIAYLITFYFAVKTNMYLPIIIYTISIVLATIYDLYSKKFPGMDVFVTTGIFFLIIYGATTVTGNITNLSQITWIIAAVGTIQVLYMQFITGGLKDAENDYIQGGKTLALKMGVQVKNKILTVPLSFKALAYLLQIVDIGLAFLPFFILIEFQTSQISIKYVQWALIGIIALIMLTLSYNLLEMKEFKRSKARKLIGLHYVINYGLMPVILMTFNPLIGIIVLMPPLAFIIWNKLLFKTIFEPKTM